MAEKINIAIIHFNTPKLTECLIRSINKFTPNSTIYVFDNSDRQPFTYRQDNIKYIDNTRGQIIDFDKWLQKYPNREKSNGKQNKFGSAKHCYTIQKCIETIGENFILLDSDVLLKKDISDLFNSNYIYVGKSEFQTNCKNPAQHKIKRILPFICFINVELCQKYDVHYFNEDYMNGLYTTPEGDLYDTGGGFLKEISKKALSGKEVNINDYIVHYNAGSWRNSTADEWLKRYRKLYCEPIIVSLTSHGTRIKHIMPSLKSLATQSLKPDKIILNICEKEKNLVTKELKVFAVANHIEIYYFLNDIGPHAKYFYTMKRFKNACIITVDDDIIYSPDMILSLYEDFERNRNCIIARRVHKIKYNGSMPLPYNKWVYEFKDSTLPSYDIFPTGVGGVLYPPDILKISDECLPDIRKCLYADDVYLKYRSLELNVLSKWVKNSSMAGSPIKSKVFYSSGLALANNLKNRNDEYIKILGMKKHESNNKKVIYTCITGAYELLDDPFVISPGYDYVCFTNYNKIQSDIWEIRPIPKELDGLSEVKKQRCIKICPHKYLPEYELSIWVDGSVKLKKDVNTYVNQNIKNGSVFIPRHPRRSCIYEECKACISMKKDKPETINAQKEKYRKEGFPENYGLVQSNIVIRYHNEPDCIKLMEAWCNELKAGSHRDQLSFNYVLWKNPDVRFVYLDKNLCATDYFKWDNSHGKKKTAATTKPSPSPKYAMSTLPEKDKIKAQVITKKNVFKEENRENIELRKEAKTSKSNILNSRPSLRRQILSRRLKSFLGN